MQPAVYREDLYRLKLSESPTKSEALSFRIRRYADTVLQSSHKAILKVPASKKFVLYLKATASVFSLANKIYRIFTKEITPIEGLDPAVRAVMMQGLEKLFDQYAEKMISPTILKLGLLKKCKSDYFDQLVVGVCKQIPVEVLRKLQAEKIKGLFDEGYLETFKEVLSEVGSDWALDKVEAFLTQQVVDSLDILAQEKDALIDKEWISISRAYHAEKIELVDGRTTIDLYSIDALGNGLIDQDLGEVVIYRYAELTQEQLRRFDELVNDVKNPAKHLGSYAAQFPEVIAHHLGKKHQKVSLKKDPLLGGNYLLLKAQQQLPSKNCLISLLLAETSLLFFQRQKSLSQEDLQALSSQLNHLIARIKTAPEDAGKNRDLTAAEELKGKVRKELVKRIKSQAAASPPIQDHVIPPFVHQIIHGFFSQVSAMPVLFEQIGIGLEIALGPDCRSLIAAARKEYEKFQATQPKKLDFSSVKLPEYAVSLGAFAFLHFAVYDLIFIALGFIFPPAWAYGSLVKGVAAASASLTCAQLLLPERMEMIAIRAIHHILFVAVPHLVALSIYFFVSREIQAELQYQIKLIDALTFKTTYRPTEENIAAKVILPDQTPYQTAQELSARLRQNREEFHQAILQELDECQQDEMVAQLEKTVAKIVPCESASCDSRALEFVWQRCRPEEKELVNFTLDLLRPTPIASKALFKQVKLVWTNREGGKKSFKVICTFDSDSEQSIESDLVQLVKSLQPGQMERWCAKLEAADPQKRGVSLLRRYEIFAMDHLAIGTGTALIGLGRLHQLSSKALSDHLLFWKKIVEAELDFPDFSGEEKANLAQILLSTAEDLKRHRREKITFFPSSTPSALKKVLADQLTYFRSELPRSLPKPPSFPGLVLAPEEKIGDGQVFRSPDRVAALAPSPDSSFLELLKSLIDSHDDPDVIPKAQDTLERLPIINPRPLFADGIPDRIKTYPSKTKQEVQQICQHILELEGEYPADSVASSDELVRNFNQMYHIYRKQLGLAAVAADFGVEDRTLEHVKQAALVHFGQAVSKLEFVHLTIEAPFFLSKNWTISHTMQLCRLIHVVDDIFTGSNASFELRVWLAAAHNLASKLLDREWPAYRPVSTHFVSRLKHAGLLRTSQSRQKFLLLYRRLVAELPLQVVDEYAVLDQGEESIGLSSQPPQDPRLVNCIMDLSIRPITLRISDLLSRPESRYLVHGEQEFRYSLTSLNRHFHPLGHTETPLEDMLICLKRLKRGVLKLEDTFERIDHTFHTQVVSDLTRYEKEIALNLKQTFELFDILKGYYDSWRVRPSLEFKVFPLLAFLEECLVRRAPGFLPRLKDRCIHEKIVLNAVHFADAEEDVLRFLLVDCESSSPALEALAVPIRAKFWLEHDRLMGDDAFIKRVVAYLMQMQSLDPMPLEDFRIVAIDPDIILENEQYRVSVSRSSWIVDVLSLEQILRSENPKIQRYRHISDITYGGIDCFPIAFKKQCDAKDFFASVGTFQEESLIVIHRQQKVQQVLRVNHEKKEQLLKSAIIFPSKPLIRIPTDPMRLPAHIARFFIGQQLQFYDTLHHGIVVELVSASMPFSLQFDQDQVTCSLHPEAKLSLDQTFADRELFPNYLIFEHGKKKFALVVSVPFFAAIPSHFSHPWRENIAAVLPMIPAAHSLQDMREFHLVALTDQRKVAPVTTDDFAMILFGTYAKDGDRFEHALSLLMQKIELEEPLHGQIKPWLLFLGLSLLQNISKDQVTRQKILKALISFIAKQAPELSLVEKAPVVLSTVWIYLQDLMAQDDELTPVSADEGMLLKEFFGCIEAMNLSQADHPQWAKMISWLHQFITIPRLIELLSTDALTRRLEAIDAKYHESWVPKGSKILWGALQAPTKYWFSSPPLKIFVKRFIQSKIFWVFWKFSTAPILTLKSLGRVPDQKFAMTPKAFMESEVHLKECFHNYLETLFQKDSSPLKLDLETSLDSPWIMDTSHRLALKFLRWIYRKKKAHGEMNLPTDLRALLEEFYRLESSTRQVSWTHLIRSEIEKAGSSLVAELGKHSEFEVARMISGSLKAVHSALPILNSFFHQRLKPLEPQKVMGQVLIGQSVVDHNAFFHQIFCQIATRYFNAYILDRQEFQSIRHDGGGHALQSYFAERVESSFEALRKIPSELSYALKSGRSLALLKDEIQAISAQLTQDCQLLEQKILSCVREETGWRVPIDQLYHLALQQDGAGLFSQQYQLRPKQAAIVMDQLIQLALCQTYRVKCSSILQLIEEGSIDAAAKKILEPKNYPLATDRDHRLMLGCLVFEAKNQVWLRPLQAKQMILALEGEKQSHLIEMIPGSGKTAYAILMDCYHRHEKGCALFAILTKELVTSMRQDVASRFYRMTGKSVFFMAIDRQKTGNLELERLKLRMMRSQESGDVIITTKEDLQAIELLYLENLLAGASFDERKHRVLKELLGIVSNSHGVVDECHEILRPDESEKFPLGSAQSVNREEILGIEVVVKFLHQVKTDSRQTFSAIFTSSEHLRQIAQAIAFQDDLGITADQQQELTRYLSDITVDMPRWLLSHPAKRQLVMSRGVMTQLIPACVKDKVHTTYGLSRKERDQKYVIPFSSNNTPIEGSIFQSPHETLFKTYLYYLESPGDIDLGTLREKIHEQLLLEADRYHQLKESTPFASTIVRLFGSLDPTDQELNHQPAALALLYVTLAVAPTLKFFEYSIESTSAAFAAMLGTKDYFSGTTYNCSLYPQPFKTLAVKETTAMTLHSVKTQFEQSGKIVRVDHAAECIEKMDSFELLIDSGALFNGYSNLRVAELIVDRLKKTGSAIKAVLFFDETNRLKALLLETEGVVDYDPDQLSPEERVTYLDQSHTFGVDIPQKRGAKALVTIGGNHLAQFEQACWRLRGLRTFDQSVSFALLPDVPSDCLDFDRLISYLVSQEHELLKSQGLSALFQQMYSGVRKLILQKSWSEDVRSAKRMIEAGREFFVEQQILDPLLRYAAAQNELPTEQVIERFRAVLESKIRAFRFFTPQEQEALIQGLPSSQPIIKPATTLAAADLIVSIGGAVVKQQQLLMEEVRQLQREVIHAQPQRPLEVIDPPYRSYPAVESFDPRVIFALTEAERARNPLAMPVHAIQSIFAAAPNRCFQVAAMFLSPNVLVAENLMPIARIEEMRRNIFKRWIGRLLSMDERIRKREICDLLLIQNKTLNRWDVMALDLRDSIFWEKKLLTGHPSTLYRFSLVKLETGSCVHKTFAHADTLAYMHTPEFKKLLLQYKILNCSDDFTGQEQVMLLQMIRSVNASGISFHEMKQALNAYYQIQRRNRNPLAQSPLVAFIDQLESADRTTSL